MRPSIVIFIADDLGYDDLGCYGSTLHRTPRLDALAAGGARFTDFHANSMCSPSRAALLTGRYPQRCALEHVLGPDPQQSPGMPSDEPTFAHSLHDAGYATGMFGKYHTGHIPLQSPLKMGFDIYRGNNGGMDHHVRFSRWGEATWYHDETVVEEEPGYSTDIICNHALDFISAHQDEPFVCYIADWMVHFPWQGPNDPADFAKGVNNNTPEKKFGSVKDRRRAYGEMVESLDRSVGRVVDHLDALGLSENTLLFFSSDNGGHPLVCDNKPLRGHKGTLYEGGHRVPAIAYWPGRIPAHSEITDASMLHDLLPTMLELAGAEPPPSHAPDGVSLLSALTTGAPLGPRMLFWRYGPDFAVRTGRWKLIHCEDGEAIYDLESDLSETRDITAEHPGVHRELLNAYDAWCVDVDRDGQASMARRP